MLLALGSLDAALCVLPLHRTAHGHPELAIPSRLQPVASVGSPPLSCCLQALTLGAKENGCHVTQGDLMLLLLLLSHFFSWLGLVVMPFSTFSHQEFSRNDGTRVPSLLAPYQGTVLPGTRVPSSGPDEKVEKKGIDPFASCMLSTRSTI
jgi:hypothetical protein